MRGAGSGREMKKHARGARSARARAARSAPSLAAHAHLAAIRQRDRAFGLHAGADNGNGAAHARVPSMILRALFDDGEHDDRRHQDDSCRAPRGPTVGQACHSIEHHHWLAACLYSRVRGRSEGRARRVDILAPPRDDGTLKDMRAERHIGAQRGDNTAFLAR